MTNKEIRLINDEIEDLESNYVEQKIDYEKEKAELLLDTDFASAIGKAKPTVAEKDAYVKLQLADREEDYKELGVRIGAKKRMYEILLKELGDNE